MQHTEVMWFLTVMEGGGVGDEVEAVEEGEEAVVKGALVLLKMCTRS